MNCDIWPHRTSDNLKTSDPISDLWPSLNTTISITTSRPGRVTGELLRIDEDVWGSIDSFSLCEHLTRRIAPNPGKPGAEGGPVQIPMKLKKSVLYPQIEALNTNCWCGLIRLGRYKWNPGMESIYGSRPDQSYQYSKIQGHREHLLSVGQGEREHVLSHHDISPPPELD